MKRISILVIMASLLLIVSSCGGGGGGSTDNTTTNDTTNGGIATLNWVPPTTYTDGSAFNDLKGHNIYMDSGNGFEKIGTINSSVDPIYQVNDLLMGETYTFAVTAFDSQNIESSLSLPASITI